MFLILCLLCLLCIFIADSKQQKKTYYERQHQSYKTYERKEFNKKPFFIIVGIIVFLFLLGYSFRQGRITMRTEMQQIAAETKEEHDEEIAKFKEQYEQQIAELNNTIETKDEEINNLKQQMDEQNEIIFDKQEEIYELENQLETTKNNNYISHDEFIVGNDSDNDGDNQYDNEYADPDRIYIDENGNIIYDDHNNYNYPSYDVDDNESSNYGDYYIARGNSYYHNSPNCKYLQGADTDRVTKEKAISNGKHECNCVKYGY